MDPFSVSGNEAKPLQTAALLVAGLTLLAPALAGCGEKGESGTTGVNCGEHGTAHGDHCHCDQGFLFDGATCLVPDDIDEICEAHADELADAGAAQVDGGHDEEAHEEHNEEAHEEHDDEGHDAHAHGACRCPAKGDCHCDHGQIEEHGGLRYCVPELH